MARIRHDQRPAPARQSLARSVFGIRRRRPGGGARGSRWRPRQCRRRRRRGLRTRPTAPRPWWEGDRRRAGGGRGPAGLPRAGRRRHRRRRRRRPGPRRPRTATTGRFGEHGVVCGVRCGGPLWKQPYANVLRSAVGRIIYHLANKNLLLWIGPLYYNTHYQS